MTAQECPYQILNENQTKKLKINCKDCSYAISSIHDAHCRKNIFKILTDNQNITSLSLNHSLVKIYQGKHLQTLKDLSDLQNKLRMHTSLLTPKQDKICKQCSQKTQKNYENIIQISKTNPIEALAQLNQSIQTIDQNNQENCIECIQSLTQLIHYINSQTPLYQHLKKKTSDNQIIESIEPYIRPAFIDSYIQRKPPKKSIFLKSYEIIKENRRPMKISLYSFTDRPEKLYFVVPSEYDIPKKELALLDHLQNQLSNHHPDDASFLDAKNTQEYFKQFATKKLLDHLKETNQKLPSQRIEYLTDIFARYTAGFGILEDLLLDEKIQDIYINAPVEKNPLHLVVDGEEYTTNIFLSTKDIDSLSSRLRSISGRAFSQANPVLDMDIANYNTRVAAISKPLTPKGVALALRRHRNRPWTLTQFIANNMISADAAGLLSFLIDGQASLLISGSRGAGKTSLLSSLILEIPQRYRILTLEDTAELPIEALQNQGFKIQSLITKSIATQNISSEVDPTDALRTALRLGESVLILGEVRGVEAKVLFEAMRIGAAGNLIMGTIHGSTTRDVYERVVYDIGVPATSFKAVDAVAIAAPIRVEGGISKKRRVTQISEISKTSWTSNPCPDDIFKDLMVHTTSNDTLRKTENLKSNCSEIIAKVAEKWGISYERALQNIALRSNIKKTIVAKAKQLEAPELLEAETTIHSNNAFWMLIEEMNQKKSAADYNLIYLKWKDWFNYYIKGVL